ncbi:MAG: MBOAT family protein [Bacteroidales bacterium]|nr:MBOAT family protein [Bacteroidales bacterium]
MGELLSNFFSSLFSFDQTHPLLFTQFYFWAFFAIVFAGFCIFKNKMLLRNSFLFFVSLFFYYKTSGLFVILLLFVVLYNWLAGKWMFRTKRLGWQYFILVLSLVVDLSALVYYKYAYFLIDVVNNIFGTEFIVRDVIAGFGNSLVGQTRFSVDSIFLPVGISFFTFQAISYMMDLWRKRIEPVKNVLDFGFYLTFFPQLVAGPIVRAKEFIPQLHKPFFLSKHQFGLAVFWILNGLAKKIILSDYLASNFIDRVFENPLLYTGFENLFALFAYSLQVYADFSGYTDIATGVAMLMGFYLPKNFNSPYKAKNAGEFWKRWHISLSKWLQDYLYISMGGNRNATVGTWICIFSIAAIGSILSGSWIVAAAVLGIALIVFIYAKAVPSNRKEIVADVNRLNTMLLGGIWHGSSWNFMIWGELNGIGMLIYRFWNSRSIYMKTFVICAITGAFYMLGVCFPAPVFNMFFVWTLLIAAGTVIRCAYSLIGGKGEWKKLSTVWAVAQTFTFITFTRLFFRSGSNLDPAEANEVAWNTAKNMVGQIGGHWDVSIIPQILYQYRGVAIMFVLGMIIHWLPDNFKRRYRIWFTRMPVPVIVLIEAIAVFIIYQFITADLQTFIYFQF